MKLPDEDRKKYERYLEDLHYQASMVESSYGIGIIKGKIEGKKECITEDRIEIARNLTDILDDKTISERT